MRTLLALACLLAGCASAGVAPTGNNPDSGSPQDGPDDPPDSPPAAVEVTLSQTTSANIAAGSAVTCNDTVTTAENSFYRVFPLAASGITNTFNLESVTFGVETAVGAANATQNVTVKVGTYGGTIAANTAGLDLAQMQQLATVNVAVPDGDLVSITTPITATLPPNSQLFVELLSADAGNNFFPGTNNGGESLPGFIRAPDCGATAPQNYSTAAGAPMHVLITATGTH